jgi:CRP-like cAMP-binding protein
MLTTATSLSFPTKACLSFSPRSILSRSNELWAIKTGFVRVSTKPEEGCNLTLGIWSAGDVVGKALSTIQPYQIECLTSVQAVAITINDLSNPAAVVLKHLHQAEELMLIRSYKRIDIMLLKLLIWLANRFGQDANQGRLIDLRLTHQDLSELLGTTRVTVTRALIQLEQQGFIQRLSLQRIVLQQAEYWHYEI